MGLQLSRFPAGPPGPSVSSTTHGINPALRVAIEPGALSLNRLHGGNLSP